MSVLTEHKVEPDDFVQLVAFNKMVKEGDLEGAYAKVEEYRAQLLKAMGREAPGVDLLVDHPDLKAKVDNAELSREDALQLVQARRQRQAFQQQAQQQQAVQQSQTRTTQSQNAALQAVQQWNAKIAADVDYAEKAGKIQPLIAEIVKEYPPELWAPTLDRLYKTIQVAPAQQQQQRAAPMPLRPSGVRGGAAAPGSMLEALEGNIPHAY